MSTKYTYAFNDDSGHALFVMTGEGRVFLDSDCGDSDSPVLQLTPEKALILMIALWKAVNSLTDSGIPEGEKSAVLARLRGVARGMDDEERKKKNGT